MNKLTEGKGIKQIPTYYWLTIADKGGKFIGNSLDMVKIFKIGKFIFFKIK